MTPTPDSVVAIDVGSSSVRAVRWSDDGRTLDEARAPIPVHAAVPGEVTFDADGLVVAALDVARTVIERASGPIAAIGITNQRASAVVWDPTTGAASGPGISWQDLRTTRRCTELLAEGIGFAPNQTGPKLEWLRAHGAPSTHLAGTIDAFLVWHLTEGRRCATDVTNAATTGMTQPDGRSWDERILGALDLPVHLLPEIVPTVHDLGPATALDGAPPIRAVIGDQQASLIGQGAIEPGMAKITFGTGAMLDVCLAEPVRHRHGTYPVVAWAEHDRTVPGLEGMVPTAGAALDWLVDGLGILDHARDAGPLAASVPDSGDVVFVPALAGFGTPEWDAGARGHFVGLTRGTGRAEMTRAVLEGVAAAAAALVDAAAADLGAGDGHPTTEALPSIRIDGGMTADPVFVQFVADFLGRPIVVSSHREATAAGAAAIAGLGSLWDDLGSAVGRLGPTTVVEPARTPDRDRHRDARDRARSHHRGPASALDASQP